MDKTEEAQRVRAAKADLAEILERRPDLKGKSMEAVTDIAPRDASIAQTSNNLTEVDLAERSDDRLTRLDPGAGQGLYFRHATPSHQQERHSRQARRPDETPLARRAAAHQKARSILGTVERTTAPEE